MKRGPAGNCSTVLAKRKSCWSVEQNTMDKVLVPSGDEAAISFLGLMLQPERFIPILASMPRLFSSLFLLPAWHL
jgi:hypothetical protein